MPKLFKSNKKAIKKVEDIIQAAETQSDAADELKLIGFKKIGSGVDTDVYSHDTVNFVVKLWTHHELTVCKSDVKKELTRLQKGFATIPSLKNDVLKPLIICPQKHYVIAPKVHVEDNPKKHGAIFKKMKTFENKFGDMHEYNLGTTKRGKILVIDYGCCNYYIKRKLCEKRS